MLTKCGECGRDVSDTAETCPGCGYRLIGREFLVRCPGCNGEVIPIFSPNDTISRYCPICKQPITNLGARRAILVVVLGVFVAMAVAGFAAFLVFRGGALR
jgi:hypothetical protein